jgi:hypothetical protein
VTDEQIAAGIKKILDSHKNRLANCERMIELLQPEWKLFEARTGHNVYVARDYVEHVSAARKHREAIELFEAQAAEIARLRERLTQAIERLRDMLQGDDGQAWGEAQRFVDIIAQETQA